MLPQHITVLILTKATSLIRLCMDWGVVSLGIFDLIKSVSLSSWPVYIQSFDACPQCAGPSCSDTDSVARRRVGPWLGGRQRSRPPSFWEKAGPWVLPTFNWWATSASHSATRFTSSYLFIYLFIYNIWIRLVFSYDGKLNETEYPFDSNYWFFIITLDVH